MKKEGKMLIKSDLRPMKTVCWMHNLILFIEDIFLRTVLAVWNNIHS